MPLPSLISKTYPLTLFSTGQEVEYRPFVLKEERDLVEALNTQDPKVITKTIQDVICRCVMTDGVDISSLPTFDLELLFLNIRGKSVGNTVEVNIMSPDDGQTLVPVEINLNDVKVHQDKKHTNVIELGDDLRMVMKYPTMDQFIKLNFSGSDELTTSFEVILNCVDRIVTSVESWSYEDTTKEELMDFLEGMNSSHFEQIESFFDTMPKLTHEVEVTNPNTGVTSKVNLIGLSSFFS